MSTAGSTAVQDVPDLPPVPARTRSTGGRADVAVAGAAIGLIVVAAVVGGLLVGHGVPVHAGAAPLFATIRPHAGAGSVLAVLVGGVLVVYAPLVASRLRIAWVAPAAGVAALGWASSLALVRGTAGITHPLSAPSEYLADLPRIGPISTWLAGFVQGIPDTSAAPWTTHVAGHPPGMTLVFVLLDRAGLGGPWPAGLACLLAWGVAVAAAAATIRSVCGETTCRRAVPFLVLLPAVVWAGVSADPLLAGTGAVAMLLLARATAPGRSQAGGMALALASGLVFGLCCFLSYGAPLLAVPALALLVARRPPAARAAVVVGGVAAAGLLVVLAFHLAGFDWWQGYSAVRDRYYAGFGGERPYGYWVWADFAALAVAAGPAAAAGIGRAVRPGAPAGVRLLVLGALAAVTLAALSGMSKAEVERIWLPWVLWLTVGCALLPAQRQRPWLVAQVVTALLVEHLLLTPW